MTIIVTCLLAVPAAQADGSRVSERELAKAVLGSGQPVGHAPSGNPSRSETCRSARRGLAYYQAATQRWYAQMDKRITPRQRGRNCKHVRRLADNWHGRARIARQTYAAWFRRIYEKWRCIHEHEGAWTSNTGNGYYGGLQMTSWFQQNYGPEFWRRWGYAHRWPVWAQIIAAERAWRECECFRQWGTAGMCGLR